MIVAYLSCLVLYFALNRLLRKKSFSEKSILFTIKTFLGLALLVLSAISFFVSEWWVGIVFIVISLVVLFGLDLFNDSKRIEKDKLFCTVPFRAGALS